MKADVVRSLFAQAIARGTATEGEPHPEVRRIRVGHRTIALFGTGDTYVEHPTLGVYAPVRTVSELRRLLGIQTAGQTDSSTSPATTTP